VGAILFQAILAFSCGSTLRELSGKWSP